MLSSHDPLSPILPPSAFYGLLTDPVGTYGRCSYGGGIAVTLRGSEAFIKRAGNLFASFGGESWHPDGRGGVRRESRESVVHKGEKPCTAYLGLTEARIKTALRLYLYGQLCAAKALRHYVRDEEGEVVSIEYLNETELMDEATMLANAFYDHHMEADYSVVPDNAAYHPTPITEYAVLEPAAEPEEEKPLWEILRPTIA